MLSNMLNDLAEAMKALDGKKRLRCLSQRFALLLEVVQLAYQNLQ